MIRLKEQSYGSLCKIAVQPRCFMPGKSQIFLTTLSKKVGLAASKRSVSSCSVPRATLIYWTWTGLAIAFKMA